MSHNCKSHYIKSWHVTSRHVMLHMSHHITSCHVMSHHFLLLHVMSHHIMLQFMSCHTLPVTSYHITSHHWSYHVTSHHITSCHTFYVTSRHSFHDPLYHIMSCHTFYATPHYVTSHYVMSYHIIFTTPHHITLSYFQFHTRVALGFADMVGGYQLNDLTQQFKCPQCFNNPNKHNKTTCPPWQSAVHLSPLTSSWQSTGNTLTHTSSRTCHPAVGSQHLQHQEKSSNN